MGYLDGFLVTLKQHRVFGGKRVTTPYSGGRVAKKGKTTEGRDEKIAKPERLHGRHVLNRYEDGMEKCIGCELCAGVCPAKCIYVRGADNDPPTTPRRPASASASSTRSTTCAASTATCAWRRAPPRRSPRAKLFEFCFTNRQRRHLHQGRAGGRRRRQAPAAAVGGLARGRGPAHQRLDARHRRRRRRRLRRRGRLVRRARLRRARRRADAGRGRRRAEPRIAGWPR